MSTETPVSRYSRRGVRFSNDAASPAVSATVPRLQSTREGPRNVPRTAAPQSSSGLLSTRETQAPPRPGPGNPGYVPAYKRYLDGRHSPVASPSSAPHKAFNKTSDEDQIQRLGRTPVNGARSGNRAPAHVDPSTRADGAARSLQNGLTPQVADRLKEADRTNHPAAARPRQPTNAGAVPAAPSLRTPHSVADSPDPKDPNAPQAAGQLRNGPTPSAVAPTKAAGTNPVSRYLQRPVPTSGPDARSQSERSPVLTHNPPSSRNNDPRVRPNRAQRPPAPLAPRPSTTPRASTPAGSSPLGAPDQQWTSTLCGGGLRKDRSSPQLRRPSLVSSVSDDFGSRSSLPVTPRGSAGPSYLSKAREYGASTRARTSVSHPSGPLIPSSGRGRDVSPHRPSMWMPSPHSGALVPATALVAISAPSLLIATAPPPPGKYKLLDDDEYPYERSQTPARRVTRSPMRSSTLVSPPPASTEEDAMLALQRKLEMERDRLRAEMRMRLEMRARK